MKAICMVLSSDLAAKGMQHGIMGSEERIRRLHSLLCMEQHIGIRALELRLVQSKDLILAGPRGLHPLEAPQPETLSAVKI